MNPWQERWVNQQIGWHEADGNKYLKAWWPQGKYRVLVPFCGKAVDMLWLAEHGNEVVGVELSPLAAVAFFEEHALDYDVSDHDDGQTFVSRDGRITIEVCDFLAWQGGSEPRPFTAHFDRGALIALPPNERRAYASHVSSLLSDSAVQLVITLDYEQARVKGPPFAVPPEELLSYWPTLTAVASHDDLANCPPKFRGKGLEAMIETAWLGNAVTAGA